MGMEAADPILKIKTAAVIGSIISGSRAVVVAQLAPRPLLSIPAFRAKFGLRVIWLLAVRVDAITPPAVLIAVREYILASSRYMVRYAMCPCPLGMTRPPRSLSYER